MVMSKIVDAHGEGGVRDIEPAELRHRLTEVRIIDVREPSEWSDELGHIDGAVLVPLAQVREAQSTWDKRQPVVIVCRSGRRSMAAARLLVELGFQQVMNLRGGMLAYRARGGDT